MAPGTNNQRAVPRYRTSCCRQGCLGLKEVFHKGCLRERHSGIDCNLPPKGKGPRCPGPLPWCGGAGLDLGLVAAGPELHRVAEVLALSAVALVLLALAALQDVRAAETDQQVVAGRTLEGVVGRRSGQDVVALAAGEVEVDPAAAAGLAALDVVGERRALGLLEVDDDIVAVTALGEAQAHVQVDTARSVAVDDRVRRAEAVEVARVTVQVIVVQATLDRVGSVSTVDLVLAGVTEQLVGVICAVDDVVAVVAVDGVVVLAAEEEVVVGTTVDGVVALTGVAERVPRQALVECFVDAVLARSGVDRVIALTGDDVVVGVDADAVVGTRVVDGVVAGVAPDVVVAGTRVDVVVSIVRVVVTVADLEVAVELVLTHIGGQAVVALATTEAVVVVVGDGARVGQGVVPVLAEQIVEALATLDGVVSATGLLVVDVGEVTEQVVVADAAVQVVVPGVTLGIIRFVQGVAGVVHRVVPVATEVVVEAVEGVHRVVAPVAEQVVVVGVAGDGVARLGAVDVVEPVQRVGAVAGRRAVQQVDRDARSRVAVVDGVVGRAATGEVVVTGAALDAVVVVLGVDRVVPGTTRQEVLVE